MYLVEGAGEMTQIYMIRHGQTDSNVRHTCLGHKDIPLNDTGQQQVRELTEKLRGQHFDALYTSPLQRALQTAEPILQTHPGLTMTMSYALIERDYGQWDDLTFDEIKAREPQRFEEWKQNWTGFQLPGGESAGQVHERIGKALDHILAQHEGQTVAIVSHLGAIRHMISYLLELAVEDSWHFTADNCGIAIIETGKRNTVLKALNW